MKPNKQNSISPQEEKVLSQNILHELESIYNSKIKGLENTYSYESFHSPSLSSAEIHSKPIVLLLGQYSTGKTSFIKYLLREEYPGTHIGPEPTTDRFIAVMHGEKSKVIPGNVASSQPSKPFKGLETFGNSFLSKFQISECDCELLQKVTFIDTPGVLSGEKQTLGRSYDFVSVCEWFAERSDMILLMFDAYKLDISDEFKRVINILKGHDDKIRIILNKASMISLQQLLRVYGALMWSLGKVISTPEVIRVYIGSFFEDLNDKNPEYFQALIEKEHEDLIGEIEKLQKSALLRKVNGIVRRARIAKVHAFIIGHLKNEMPTLFGKVNKQSQLIRDLKGVFDKIQRHFCLAPGDFPSVEKFQETLKLFNFSKFPRLSQRQIGLVNQALTKDLPELLQKIPTEKQYFKTSSKNPFSLDPIEEISENKSWSRSAIQHDEYERIFNHLLPSSDSTHLSGDDVKDFFAGSEVGKDTLASIWQNVDRDHDGRLSREEFCVAMHLIKLAKLGIDIPSPLPTSLFADTTNGTMKYAATTAEVLAGIDPINFRQKLSFSN